MHVYIAIVLIVQHSPNHKYSCIIINKSSQEIMNFFHLFSWVVFSESCKIQQLPIHILRVFSFKSFYSRNTNFFLPIQVENYLDLPTEQLLIIRLSISSGLGAQMAQPVLYHSEVPSFKWFHNSMESSLDRYIEGLLSFRKMDKKSFMYW